MTFFSPTAVRACWSALAVLALAATAGCSGPAGTVGVGSSPSASPSVDASASGGPGSASATTPSAAATGIPQLDVEVVTRGLEDGWDVGFLPDGQLLVTQLPARIVLLSGGRSGARVTPVEADLSDVMVRGEGGLLGMVIHPDFATSREFTTCQDHQENGSPVDIRLVTWRLSEDGRRATKVKDLVTGLPIAASGRHSGCRPTIAADGTLIVGTGDTAHGDIPQDRTRLGGKTLRLDLKTGRPAPDNPFVSAKDPAERLVYTYGHRNVQGIAVRPGTGQVFSVEHGPDVDDEVNLLTPGGNYGWDPSRGGTVSGYDESVPMTDTERFPNAVRAVWSSGDPTVATCAGAFLSGTQWAGLDGALAVTTLKGERLLLISMDRSGRVSQVRTPGELKGSFGRLRAARVGPDGALYLTTSNGGDDALLRVTPKAG